MFYISMNTYTFMLSKPRFPSFVTVTVHSMYAIVTVLLVLLTVVSSATTRDDHSSTHNFNNNKDYPNFSGIQKRDANNDVMPYGEVNSNKVTPQLNGGVINNNNSNNNTSSTTPPAMGPELAHDKNVHDKLNCSLEAGNKTNCQDSRDQDGYFNSLKKQMFDNKDMLLRTLYVTLGITGIIVVYFVARTLWLRKRRTKSRKYRIIAQNGDQRDLEMEPLGDGNDDDEDYTVFELNGRKK